MTTIQQPFNDAQLELLKLFSREIPQEDLIEIKRLIVRYFAKKAIESANKVWEKNDWNEEDEKRLLSIHERTPYSKK